MRALLLIAAGLNGAAAVAIGALAQHLWAGDPHRLLLAETGVRYGLPHAAALLALGLAAATASPAPKLLAAAALALGAGATLFSLSLYALAAGASAAIAAATPVGGTLMILGWLLLLGYGLWCSRSGSRSAARKP